MFIAHIPVGYIAAKLALPKPTARSALLAMVIGSILPDLDLLWFYLVDNRAHHHHDYITHKPIFWLGIFVIGLLIRAPKLRATVVLATIAALVHLVCDSIAGKITWGWPFSDTAVTLVTVPAKYDWWVWNFVLHWTFLLELALVGLAAALFLSARKP